MKITIKEDGKERNIILPTGLLLNGLSANLIANKADIGEGDLKAETLNKAFKALKSYARRNPDFVLVEVEEGNGESVRITL